MSLQQELSNFATQMSKQVPKEVLETLGNFMSELNESGIVDNALKVGDMVSNFSVLDDEGNLISLHDLTKEKPLILSFNRGNWCPFCNIEFVTWQKEQSNITSANFAMIMPQLKEKSAQIKSEKGLSYRILEDKGNVVADQFGLKFKFTQPLQEIHKALGIDIPAHNGDNSFELSLPATYVIDQNQKVKYAFVNPNWMERAEPSEVLNYIYNTI